MIQKDIKFSVEVFLHNCLHEGLSLRAPESQVIAQLLTKEEAIKVTQLRSSTVISANVKNKAIQIKHAGFSNRNTVINLAGTLTGNESQFYWNQISKTWIAEFR